MHRVIKLSFIAFIAICTGLLGLAAAPAGAQTYVKLQVLLPGETAAPGTLSGKTGTPVTQTAGIPFTIGVRACDAEWNTVASITHVVSISSTDESANLPGPTQLVGGPAQITVTLNSAGSFTFSARDDSDPTVPEATSAYIESMVMQGFRFNYISQKHVYAGVPESYTITAIAG